MNSDQGYSSVYVNWTNTVQYVSLSFYCSDIALVNLGVHHDSVHGHILLCMYIKPLPTIIDSHTNTHGVNQDFDFVAPHIYVHKWYTSLSTHGPITSQLTMWEQSSFFRCHSALTLHNIRWRSSCSDEIIGFLMSIDFLMSTGMYVGLQWRNELL